MTNDIDKRISRALGSIRRAFRGVIRRVNSKPAAQLVQAEGMAGEKLLDTELFQHYGFTSVPLDGSMAIVLPLGGKTSHGVIIATEHGNYRLKQLKPGEVALYTDEGSKIVMKRGRLIEVECDTYRINCQTYELNCNGATTNCQTDTVNSTTSTVNASGSATYNTPTLTANQQLIAKGLLTYRAGMAGFGTTPGGGASAVIQGSVHVSEDVTASGKSLVHHNHPGDSGGVTGPPNG